MRMIDSPKIDLFTDFLFHIKLSQHGGSLTGKIIFRKVSCCGCNLQRFCSKQTSEPNQHPAVPPEPGGTTRTWRYHQDPAVPSGPSRLRSCCRPRCSSGSSSGTRKLPSSRTGRSPEEQLRQTQRSGVRGQAESDRTGSELTSQVDGAVFEQRLPEEEELRLLVLLKHNQNQRI